jgi:chloramphenicol O-acetyltransferase type A
MRYLDIEKWERKEHFEFFKQFSDPYFGLTVDVDVTKAYKFSKEHNISFFVVYLHACMIAINAIENFKYRIENDKVVIHDAINVSPTIIRPNNTFGFSYVYFDKRLSLFKANFQKEKERILNTNDLFPPVNSEDCVYCSALPWLNFSGHKEPTAGFKKESVPKIAFGKIQNKEEKMQMPVAIIVNHALMDGYHVGLFFEAYQKALNNIVL